MLLENDLVLTFKDETLGAARPFKSFWNVGVDSFVLLHLMIRYDVHSLVQILV